MGEVTIRDRFTLARTPNLLDFIKLLYYCMCIHGGKEMVIYTARQQTCLYLREVIQAEIYTTCKLFNVT